MDTRQLRAVEVLAEELNFVRAAARLGISQPALSQQLQKIEAELGVVLFSRAGRRVSLTDAGRSFRRDAAQILQDYESAVTTARRAAQGQIGRLRLGFVEAASVRALPLIVSEYRRRAPEVRLELTEMISAELADALLRGAIDVALTRPVNLAEPIEAEVILREPYVVVLPEDHRLAGAAALELGEVIDEGLILAPGAKAQYILGLFRPLFERLKRTPTITQEVYQRHVVTGLVRAGLGYSLLPRSASSLQGEGVVCLPLADADAPMAELVLAWRPSDDAATLRSFRTLVQQLSAAGRL
ncbi:LysR substrate-binding domain-containing protein [Oceanicella sp. SM1341]|uniref:LysR substrate-binding domain-containing protein n=1 Tax=Oceanicella sp. SM1341 TaxID=1548889 RepID=UPI0018E55113|nr:LysR substrate-binding domain-containing protein [Oceanicella sp. SM1341]